MQIALFVSICKNLEWKSHDILWDSLKDTKKIHTINWYNTCKPKACGGLGLHQVKHMNMTFMAKIDLGMVHKKDDS